MVRPIRDRRSRAVQRLGDLQGKRALADCARTGDQVRVAEPIGLQRSTQQGGGELVEFTGQHQFAGVSVLNPQPAAVHGPLVLLSFRAPAVRSWC